MESSGGGSNPAMRSASYSKLNEWSGANGAGGVMKARRSKLALWKTLFVGIVVILCIVVVGMGIGYGMFKMGRKNRMPKMEMEDGSATFREAAVVSQSTACADIGRDVLAKGGSAVDAGIAALICEGAYSPQSSGLGGGFFMIVFRNDTKKVEVIDAREMAPLGVTNEMYDADPRSIKIGGLSVAVPGEMRGYWLAHERHGKLNWSELFEPTIEICDKGVVVSDTLAEALNEKVPGEILQSPTMRSLFVNNATGELYKAGEIIVLPELAETLRIVAEKGAEELYRGELAKKLVADITALGGIITLKDLEIYQPEVRQPVSFQLNDTTLFSVPPPGSGLLLGFLLQILEGLNIGNENVDAEIRANHLFLEASKFAYAKRPQVADPAFVDLQNFTSLLSSPEFITRIRDVIDEQKTYDSSHYGSIMSLKADHGTAHVSVLAPNGDAVSATSTINLWFGACIRSPSTGIILNDEMDDFARPGTTNFYGIPPSQDNYMEPRKRPASSMAPSLILDKGGNVRYVFGASGGIKIISTTAYAYMLHRWLGEDISVAVSNPRIHHQLYPNIVEYEKDFSQPLLDGLKLKGHRLEPMGWLAAASMIYRAETGGKIVAGSDPRRRSRPAGI